MILPKYPVYVISKGRANRVHGLTARFLAADFVPFRLVVEPEEREQYERYVRDDLGLDPDEVLLELPFTAETKPEPGGSTPARNFVWEHSIAAGAKRHWILDDNIRDIRRLYCGKRIPCESGVAMRQVEQLTDAHKNVAVSGMNYQMFVVPESPPFRWNCHVYSFILIDNALPFRWRLRYNEDTDLCLQAVDGGWNTIQVNTFMADKQPTLKFAGGNMSELYKDAGSSEVQWVKEYGADKRIVTSDDTAKAGRLMMARSLEEVWPGSVTTGDRFGRAQHVVDWSQFDKPLELADDYELDTSLPPDEMGMRLRRRAAIDTPTLAKVAEDYEAKHGVWKDLREEKEG